jgi:sec-independent protein translocase protein TatA
MLSGHLPELLIVLTLALVIFGPKRLPEIGASLGKGIRDFRQSVSHLDTDLEKPDVFPAAETQQVVPIPSEPKAG